MWLCFDLTTQMSRNIRERQDYLHTQREPQRREREREREQ